MGESIIFLIRRIFLILLEHIEIDEDSDIGSNNKGKRVKRRRKKKKTRTRFHIHICRFFGVFSFFIKSDRGQMRRVKRVRIRKIDESVRMGALT